MQDFIQKINPKGGIAQLSGTGSPEGVEDGYVGNKYLDTSTNNLYEKLSGDATNTGWTLINGAGGGGGGAVDLFFFSIDANNILSVYSNVIGEVPSHEAYMTLPDNAFITYNNSNLNITY